MGDESQAEYEQYMATLEARKAPVIWLKSCKTCNATGKLKQHPTIKIICSCVQDYRCPQCGFRHNKPIHAAVSTFLYNCYKCGWSYV